MKRVARNLVLVTALGALTQLVACAYQQPYGQPVYAQQQVQQPGTYPIYQAQPNCAQGIMSDPTVDAVVGAGLGGLLGNQFGKGQGNAAMTALGAVAGVVAGQHVGAASQSGCN